MKNIITICLIALGLLLTSCTVKKKENSNDEASIKELDELPENPLLFTPMTISVNRKENRICSLYGNSIAIQHATKYADSNYPSGSLLYKVTWQAQPDSLWFGANIPQQVKLVERVEFDKNEQPLYEMYIGKPLKKVSLKQDETSLKIKDIIAEKMAVSP